MMTFEEEKVVCYLHDHTFSRAVDLINACFPGASLEWSARVFGNLEWLNILTVFYAKNGSPVALQITEKGMALARSLRLS